MHTVDHYTRKRSSVVHHPPLTTLEGIKCLVGVSNERKTHLSFLFIWHGTSLRSVDGASILLRNLVNREIRHIDVRAEPWLERSPNAAEVIPDHAPKEGMVLNLGCTSALATFATNTVFRVTQETAYQRWSVYMHQSFKKKKKKKKKTKITFE